ncbi:MAG: response regulator transcription factor [Defluviitaleaceae bacterium]|nr:response regulator transcription factor [Defluviitaleaceae bacterium]
MSDKILICEDEENIVFFIKAELEYEGFETDVAYDGEEAMRMFSGEYSLVLLDIMLPKKNGLECLREIRKISDIPVLILTARKEVYDKVAFLSAGADDYVTKPFDTMELIARIKRHIQRAKPPQNLVVNADAFLAKISGKDIHLTKTEFEVLNFLYTNTDKVKTRDEIIHAVFGDFYGESNVVDANIKNIRAKIANITDAKIIETVRGKGYVIRGVPCLN